VVESDAYEVVAATEKTLHADFGRALRTFLAKPDNSTYLALAEASQRRDRSLALRIQVAFYSRNPKILDTDFPEQLSHG